MPLFSLNDICTRIASPNQSYAEKDQKRLYFTPISFVIVAVFAMSFTAIGSIGCLGDSRLSNNQSATTPQHVSPPDPQKKLDSFMVVVGTLARLGENLGEALGGKSLSDDETLEKLDFSLPGDPTYDPNGKYAAFSLLSRQYGEAFQKLGNFVSQPDLDAMSGTGGARIIFNLRRIENQQTGAVVDNLWAIVPQATKSACKHVAGPDFTIAPNNHSVVFEPKDFSWTEQESGSHTACIHAQDGKEYYFVLVWTRYNKTHELR